VTFANAARAGDRRDVLMQGQLRAAADRERRLAQRQRHRDHHGQCGSGEQGPAVQRHERVRDARPGASLGAAKFTLETWFRRDGAGVATFTGTGGVTAIPLITKGMAEADDVNNKDMNYFLGIRQTDGVAVADFEDTATAGNHVVAGTTAIVAGPAWHHAAAT
jgi:hypothetical protein